MASITESEMLDELRQGICLAPLKIRPSESNTAREAEIDIGLTVDYRGEAFEFAAELKARNTPSMFAAAMRQAEKIGARAGCLSMLVLPYLNDRQLQELEQMGLSGVDLSGNGVVCVPDRLTVYRTGQPNRYPDSQPTKYAYRGTTSLVARAFLCRSRFVSYADIQDELKSRGKSVATSTVSKSIKRMESDLIVQRDGEAIRLLQPAELLEKLSANYPAPKVTKIVKLALKRELSELLRQRSTKEPVVLSGTSSVAAYAVMGTDEWPIVYTTDVRRLVEDWNGDAEPTARFVDVELRQTKDPTVYFDTRFIDSVPYASPTQVYIELSAGDKRQQEVAEQVQRLILQELAP